MVMPELLEHLVLWLDRWPWIVPLAAAVCYLVAKGFSAAKRWVEVRKGSLEIKKTKLEVTKLEEDSRTVTLATAGEIAQYDPKTASLLGRIETDELAVPCGRPGPAVVRNSHLSAVVVVVGFLVYFLFYLLYHYFHMPPPPPREG